MLKCCRRLRTHGVFHHCRFLQRGTASGEAQTLSSLLFHLGLQTSCRLSPRSHCPQSHPRTVSEHHCSSTELTALAIN